MRKFQKGNENQKMSNLRYTKFRCKKKRKKKNIHKNHSRLKRAKQKLIKNQ